MPFQHLLRRVGKTQKTRNQIRRVSNIRQINIAIGMYEHALYDVYQLKIVFFFELVRI